MTTSYEDYAYDEYISELGREEELQRAIEDPAVLSTNHAIHFNSAQKLSAAGAAEDSQWQARSAPPLVCQCKQIKAP